MKNNLVLYPSKDFILKDHNNIFIDVFTLFQFNQDKYSSFNYNYVITRTDTNYRNKIFLFSDKIYSQILKIIKDEFNGESLIFGCTDSNYNEYISNANIDDGSCMTLGILGCMNPDAINFDETATIDDEQSCIYSQDYVHGLWNEVDVGAIEYEYLQEEYNSLNANAINSTSSLQQALDTWNTSIDLSAGWNMFGYGCPNSIDLVQGLSNHTDFISIVNTLLIAFSTSTFSLLIRFVLFLIIDIALVVEIILYQMFQIYHHFCE